MSEDAQLFLLFQKDFIETGADRYFIYDEQSIYECSAQELIDIDQQLITHDFWLIAPSIYKSTGGLPQLIIDVNHLQQLLIGRKLPERVKNESRLKGSIRDYFDNREDIQSYFRSFYRAEELSIEIYAKFAEKLSSYWSDLKLSAVEKDEWERYESVEMPLANMMEAVSVRGIRLGREILAKHKNNIDSTFFKALKELALEFELEFEVPKNGYLRDLLIQMGFAEYLEGYGNRIAEHRLDDLLDLITSPADFGKKVLSLRKLERSRTVLNSIPSSKSRVRPIVEPHKTVTSRIYYQNPVVQNLNKYYRDIFCADPGYELAYADYDQFEVGIMSALSGDEALREVYQGGDVYATFARRAFGSDEFRGLSKGIFLSYTYGMGLERILKLVSTNGGDESEAEQFFDQFHRFQVWRGEIQERYLREGRIGTLLGNYRNRDSKGPLSGKESRSCISQVVQGTGSLIFKKALLALRQDAGLQVLVPMHDAVLVQCVNGYDHSDLVGHLEQAMRAVLGEGFPAKASIESFT